MRKLGWFLVIVLVLGILGGGTFLAFWDIPAPTQKIEKEVKYDPAK
jgi:hypothetical protein